MSGNALVVEQAPVLAQPTSHEQKVESHDEIVDLDAGDSLLEEKPDDGADLDTTGGDDKPAKDEPTEKEPEEEEEPADEDDELAALAALEVAPKKEKLSGSAKLKAKLAEANAEIERLRNAVPKVDDASELAAAVEREIGPPPKESDYTDYLDFTEAKTAYRTMKMMVERDLKKNAQTAKATIENHNNQIVQSFQERVAEAKTYIPDFDAVVQKATVSPSHPDTIMLILESDKGPQLSYYLSKHPEKVHEINGMSPRRQAAEIGRLEARLSTSPPKKETKAPPPAPPLRSGAPIESKDPEKMSMDEFAAWFDQKKSARR